MSRYWLLAQLAAFVALSLSTPRLDAEPKRRVPVARPIGRNPAEWPKGDFYSAGTSGNRRIEIDAKRGVLANDKVPDWSSRRRLGGWIVVSVGRCRDESRHGTHECVRHDTLIRSAR